ncbi:MAG TPA: hypothetical protein VHP81_06870, partial [Lachnospiraceae bacterium]|nr:hypothetical protein [Lachnospiraceae bacterium]
MIERIGVMQMKKRFLSMLLVITMIVMMMPTVTFAEQMETFGEFLVTATSGDASSVAAYDETTRVLKVTGDCTIANTDPSTPTNDTISIESNCTVTLDGVNIEALAPTYESDISKPNPININGAYQVTILLDKTNTLRFSAPRVTDSANVKSGSGKAGLRVPFGASLTIDGGGILLSSGAEGFNDSDGAAHGGGGAGIGGDGRRTGENQPAEASGSITIKNGTVNATGGNCAGYWGGGGAGIGGGGGSYQNCGGNNGKITVEGGFVSATGGYPGNSGGSTRGSGIGPGGNGGDCSGNAIADDVLLSGGTTDARGYYGVQGNYITISGDATRLIAQGTLQALSSEPITSDIGKIVSTTDGSMWNDANKLVQFLTAIDPDYTTVVAAKTAAENASYSNMLQADVSDETAIIAALLSTAKDAVGDSSVTVIVDKVDYTPAVAGTSADPDGTDGSYAFTITVSKGTQSQTTIQKTITITATAYTGVTDVQAVQAAKTALVNGPVNVAFVATQEDKTAAVQSYVDNLLSATANAAGVTAVVSYNSTTGEYDVVLSKGSVNDSKSLTMTVNVAADPDIATVGAAKTAVTNASYSNMNQIDVIDEATIKSELKTIAEAAVGDGSVTVEVNKVSYTPAVAGTSADPDGTAGSYAFTITVSKGSQSQTTIQKTISITATAYTGVTDVQAVQAAKAALVNGPVNVAFAATQADKTAAVQSYVDNLLSATTNAAGVTAVVTYNSTTGKYDVTLSKGSENDSKSLTMTVNVAADPDIATVEAAKTAVTNAGYSNMNQVDVTDEATIRLALKTIAEAAVGDGSVTVGVNKVSYTPAVAGTSADPDGTEGSYTFTITVSKGAQHQTTTQKTITITATAYTGVTDVQAVQAAKTTLINSSVNVAFGATQADKTAEVQSYVDGLLSAATDAAGVTAVVTYNSTTGTYDVALSKGSVNDSKSLTMTVNVAPDPDIAIVGTAKTVADNAIYSNMIQTDVTNEAAIIVALKSTAEAAVSNSSVTVTVSKVSYTPAVAGTSANPDGTDGSYAFTITVSKGSQHQSTTQKTITITATAYTGVTDVQAVQAANAALVNSSVNVAFGATQADKTAEVQSYVDGLLCVTTDAAGVTAVVSYNSTTGTY